MSKRFDALVELTKCRLEIAKSILSSAEEERQMQKNFELGKNRQKSGLRPNTTLSDKGVGGVCMIWHDLIKDKDDLPAKNERVLFFIDKTKLPRDNYTQLAYEQHLSWERECYSGSYDGEWDDKCFHNDDYEEYTTRAAYTAEQVTKWAYINELVATTEDLDSWNQMAETEHIHIDGKYDSVPKTVKYNFKICDKYCKYYDYWTYGQIKQWELEEICDKCEIFDKNKKQ